MSGKPKNKDTETEEAIISLIIKIANDETSRYQSRAIELLHKLGYHRNDEYGKE